VKGYDPRMSFLADTAARYDAEEMRGDEDAAAEFLAGLARGGRALELAIGTGRVALPLAARGVRVHGIDFSQSMVACLRAKPGGARIPVTMGDFADVGVAGRFRLVYVVFNTLFNLLTQDEQVRCFVNVATHLEKDGVFVVEGFVPAWLHRLRDGQHVDAELVGVDRVVLDVGRHDRAAQTLEESHVEITAAGAIRLAPIVCRYAWPSELDLMARIAGLRLRERWASWDRRTFACESRNCISVYGR
jgi:SAM-dependent methyltransferase